jgi:class 3 adenylate cyclase
VAKGVVVESVPETRYAKTDDGVHIAYQVVGDGPLDVIELSSGGLSLSIDATNEQYQWRRYVDRLARFSRFIRFDVRGVGLSDPLTTETSLTLEGRVADVLAVLDHAGADQPCVLATTPGGYSAMLLAATHRTRVRALILIHCIARVLQAPEYPWGTPASTFDAVLRRQFEPGQAGDDIVRVAPSKASDPDFRTWWDNAGRRGASPATARRQFAMLRDLDVRSILPSIAAPTLVLQRRDNRFVVREHGQYLAENIPGARYAELPGPDHLPWLGNFDVLVDEVQEFLTGVRPTPETDRFLATVLFSDIVDSTARTSAIGDRAWHELLDAHDAMVRRQLEWCRGREIKTMGDGFLATFDGPARAIQCGCAIRDGATQLGIEVRVGLHTGEIELRGDDIGGVTVNIGARVSALAGAGEVLVSRTVTDLVAGSGITFEDRGEHELKGVPGTWRLFSVMS